MSGPPSLRQEAHLHQPADRLPYLPPASAGLQVSPLAQFIYGLRGLIAFDIGISVPLMVFACVALGCYIGGKRKR
jgi:hypothetical protein